MYGEKHRKLQAEFDSINLADQVKKAIVAEEIEDGHREFIESRDMFFLSTIDHYGQPTVSYKGGDIGLIKVLDNKTIAFPSYDGNGMFFSAGNIACHEKIGLLLIDFETPFRLRMQGRAKRSKRIELMEQYPEAQLVFEVTIDSVWINCNRYIHRHKRLETSKYVPKTGVTTPYPAWKRIDTVKDALPYNQTDQVEAEGGVITQEQWMEKIKNLEG